MKNIFRYFGLYFKEEIKWLYFIIVIVFAAICVFLQYHFKIANYYVAHHHQSLSYYPRAFLLYAIPFVGTLILYSAFYKKWDIWGNRTFLILVFFTIAVYVWRCGITSHTGLIKNYIEADHQRYWIKISNQLVHGIALFILPFLWWWAMERKKNNLYGWKYEGISFKPYFIILLFLIPVVALASTQKDFLSAYPLVANTLKGETGNTWINGSLFELSYGFDFMMNEFFFRGFIVLAFAGFLGRGIILPMAFFYVFIHFDKPLGEAISSFFGGLALGIIAYETRSIYGGVILHIGIAWLMEIGAGLGRFFYL